MMFLRFCVFITSDITTDTGPTRPKNIVTISTHLPKKLDAAVAPADSPVVENAETASNKHCTAPVPAPASAGIEK